MCLYNYFVNVLPIQFVNIDQFLHRKLKEKKISATKFYFLTANEETQLTYYELYLRIGYLVIFKLHNAATTCIVWAILSRSSTAPL